MNTKELYLQANGAHPLTVNEFLDRLAACIRRLENRFPLSLLSDGEQPNLPQNLDEPLNLHARYIPALLAGIYAEGAGSAAAAAQFYTEADAAYISLWRDAARARQIGRAGGER